MAVRSGKRRWPWAAAIAVSVPVLVVAGWWLVRGISAFAGRPLSDQDSIASVTSMVTGAAALLVALASLAVAVLQLRRDRTPEATTGTVQSGTVQSGTAKDEGRLFMVANGDIHVHETGKPDTRPDEDRGPRDGERGSV